MSDAAKQQYGFYSTAPEHLRSVAAAYRDLDTRIKELTAALDHSRAENRALAEALKLSYETRDELADQASRDQDTIDELRCRIQELEER